MPTYIKSKEQFQNIIKNNRIVVLYLYADWCNPCKSIKDKYEQLEKKYPRVVFLKQNVDLKLEHTDIYISGIPSFYFYKNGKIVTINNTDPLNILGPKIQMIDNIVKQLLV